jgi:hypothetical protein
LACKPAAPDSVIRRDGVASPNEASLSQTTTKWQSIDCAAVPELLAAEAKGKGFSISRRAGDKGTLFHMRRQLADGELLLLVNTSIQNSSAGTFDAEARGVEKWDLERGLVDRYLFKTTSTGVQADFELPPCGSLLVFLSNEPREPAPRRAPSTQVRNALGPVEVRRLEPNVLVLDYVGITAGGETRTNLYFYQASQFAFQMNGMERNPWDSAVQFKDELITKKFPADSGFQATYRFQIEQSVPEQLWVVIERPDLYTVSCNGKVLRPVRGAWWLDKSFGKIPLSGAARVGVNEIIVQARPFIVYHELEPAYILGDFRLKNAGSGFVIVPDQPLTLGAWKEQGHPFYAAGAGYRQRFELTGALTNRYVVSLPKWYGSVAKVMANGKLSGYISHAPWECDVTKELREGGNTIEIIAVGTLKNTLGPHHGKPSLGTAWPGMFQKGPPAGPPPGADYDTVAYGVFEPFTLIEYQAAAQ